jgi:hypothetical protein
MTLEHDISNKKDELNSLMEIRPGTKQEYLSALKTVNQELSDLYALKASEDKRIAEESRIAYENSSEYKISQLNGEYDQQFSVLQSAYMAALILGDETTMKENRTAYQELLTEYNAKLEAIS